MMTKKVMRNMTMSLSMAFMERMMGPKCLETMPILIILKTARVKATPQKILPEAFTAAMLTFLSSRMYASILIIKPTKKKTSVTML